jgi:hypothetical protein
VIDNELRKKKKFHMDEIKNIICVIKAYGGGWLFLFVFII